MANFDLPTIPASTNLGVEVSTFSHREIHNRIRDLMEVGGGTGTLISATTTGSNNNYAPTGWATAGALLMSGAGAAITITGLAAPTDNATKKLLVNNNAYTCTLSHQSGSSSAANRIICPNAADLVIPAYGSVWVWYETTNSRWHVVGEHGGHGWTAFTPTLKQNGTVTATVTVARYRIVGKCAQVYVALVVTGTGTSGHDIEIELPAALTASPSWPLGLTYAAGVGEVLDQGTALYHAHVFMQSTTAIRFTATHLSVAQSIGTNPAFALASGDSVFAHWSYEIA